jgi:hypothetical protein
MARSGIALVVLAVEGARRRIGHGCILLDWAGLGAEIV